MLLCLVLLVIFIAGCTQSSQLTKQKIIGNTDYYCQNRSITDEPIQDPILCLKDEKKSLLNAVMEDWFVNASNNSELVFQYRVYNYGKVEGNGISVKCVLMDNSGYTDLKFDNYYGSLAPNSTASVEFNAEKPANYYDTNSYYSYCNIESCQNCEVLLKRIPSLVERRMLANNP